MCFNIYFMKFLIKFESYSPEKNDDIKIIEDIIEDKLYYNTYALKQEIKKIQDKKLAIGFLVDIICKYDVDKDEFFSIIEEFDRSDLMGAKDVHDYFVDKMNSDVRAKLWTFFDRQNLEKDEEFINWLKSLTEKEAQTIQEYCLELELYELIPFMKNLRNQ